MKRAAKEGRRLDTKEGIAYDDRNGNAKKDNETYCNKGTRLLKQCASIVIDVVDDMAVVIEEHALASFGSVEWPLWE